MLLVLLRLLGTSTQCLTFGAVNGHPERQNNVLKLRGNEQGNIISHTEPAVGAAKASEIADSPPKYYHLSPHMLQPGKSAVALPAALGNLLGGVDGVGNKPALDALPAVLDLDVPAPHQLKDVPRQLHKRLEKKEHKSRCG